VKRIISVFLLTIMIPQLAMASRVSDLKMILDDFTYTMEVEWDQKDQLFAALKRREFLSKLDGLVAQGITKNDIIEASGVKLDIVMQEIQGKRLTNSNEISEFLLQHREFKKGANWVGDVIIATVFFTPILVMIGFMIHGSMNREDRLNRINACLDANPVDQDHCFDLI
jgi:hypothetical protein